MATAAVDIPFLASHYAIPEIALTTLSEKPTVELVNQLLESISTKARETEELKSDKLRLEVELENAVRGGEAKVKVLKSSVEKGLEEISNLRNKLQESGKSYKSKDIERVNQNTRSRLESEIGTLKSTSSTSEAEVGSIKSRIASLEASNRDTLGLLESKSTAYDKLAEELSTQHRKTIDLRREVTALEQKIQAASSTAASTRFREQSLQQEVDLLKKNNEWFETELKTKSAEYLKFRKEKGTRISELQRLNEEANSKVESLERSENALKRRLDDIEQKYEESLTNIQQLKEEAIQAAESFRIELDSSSRLAQLQQAAAETAKQRVQEFQIALDKARDDATEQISRLRGEIETEHSDKEAAERRIAELELAIKQMETEGSAARLQPMSPGFNNGVSTPLRPGTPVGSFSPRSSRGVKGGLTLTQMYTEYDKMRTLLSAEQKNNEELKAAMDEMVQDLESRQPEIDELRSDHSRLEAAVVEMSNILDTAGKEREAATREARKWQGQVGGLEREGQILRQQLRDLSSQVKVLVMEVHLLSAGEKEYDRADLEKIAREGIEESAEDMTETGQFISRNLTTFKNLNELQEQNVTLRRMLRQLGDQMEGEEARQKDISHQKDQEELKELRVRVQTYRDEMANLVSQTKSYIKERDTFRSMLIRRRETGESSEPFSQSLPLGAAPPALDASTMSAAPGPDYADLLRKLQAHFDSFREETATDHSSLKQQVNELTRRNSELQSEVSRASSQLASAIQRAELLQSNFNLLKGENVELQKRHTALMENANKQDLRTQQVAEDLVEARGLADSLTRESANLKAEKELWKSIEKRLIEDNEALRNERSRLDSLNANLQSMLNEREHSETESRRRLQATVESLESELQITKRKLNEETEEAKKATLRKEYDHEQSQRELTILDHLQSRVDELSVELKSVEERLAVLQHKPNTSATAPTAGDESTEAVPDNQLSREQELAIEVSELKRDLELTKGELEHAKEQAEDFKAISQSTEERLEALSDTNEQYREETDRLLEEKNAKIADLEKRVEEITSELAATNNEISKLRDQEGEAQRRMDDQKEMLEAEIKRLKDNEERYTAAAQYHQQDLKAQAEIAQNAQQNYENELVKHAEAARNLQTVRAEANQLKLEVVDLRTQAESAKNNLTHQEENWNELKERYESEIGELNRRREEVLKQNSLLHGQLETITRQISALQRDRASMPENPEGETDASGTDLEGLQEVIKFLRREKEIVDVQYHLSTQEGKRLRQQLDYTRSQLEETRLKLEQQRRAEADSEHNTLNHNKLMETLNELNLFRESSVTLRNQIKQYEEAIASKSAQIEEIQQQAEPLQTRIRELENNLETKDGEVKLLQEDRDRWQQRTQNILQKYDRVDPVEMEALKEKLATLEKEQAEASTEKSALQAQIDAFPEQLKQAEEKVHDLRSKLTEQFKARSKELTGRINAKQGELNIALQEKETIQLELNSTREELNALKASVSENQQAAAAQSVPEPQPAPVQAAVSSEQPSAESAQKIAELEEKVAKLEAALAEKEAETDAKIRERIEKMKETLNNKLAEYKTAHKEQIDKMTAAHQQELAARPSGELPPELTDSQARELVAKNETIRGIVRNNIKNALARERESMSKEADPAALKEMEKKFNEEKEAYMKERDQKVNSAVELAEKRLLAKVSMTEGRARNVQAKLEVVQKAATETPQKPVVEVWEVAKVAKPAPVSQAATPKPAGQAQAPAQPAAPAPQATQQVAPQVPAAPTTPTKPTMPTDSQQTPTPAERPEQAPQAPQVPQPSSLPQPTTQVQQQQGQEQPAQNVQPQQPQHPQQPQQPQQIQQAQPVSGLPNRPPQSTHHPAGGTGPGVLRALQSGLPVARGGRGRGGPVGQVSQPHNAAGQHGTGLQPQQPQQGQQGQQLGASRGHGIPRGGGRGRGGAGRGGAQNVQTGNLPAGAGQSSPRGGRGGLNAQARQFIPQGNKRTREDGAEAPDTGNGKRIRGGGAGSG
ncbi:filament-forming protein [Trichophyton equinum CBS 127.97]|uniref:Filament-forming protein n=1 Tax=Trichophyton equinum (strain ATCC MYA-4606 / CBS 127.97) TaxID=559882 RepID=F2Q2Q0_TRIEC|nr:filament-forming protein [Trichophyton equinum CBS 127.97]